MFGWFKARRRRRWLVEPFPSAWDDLLCRHVKQSSRLPNELREKWQLRVQVFVRATVWEGCRNFVVTDAVKVIIAGYATLLVLELDDEWLERVWHVLVHPTPYQGRRASIGVDGVDYSHGDWMQQLEDDSEDEHLGEACVDSGTVILVWSEVPNAEHITPAGQNVVLHEFAHVLLELLGDRLKQTRTASGESWLAAFHAEFDRQVLATDRGRRTLLDEYAAESPEEFFCVATECFLERPDRLRSQTPTLYELLKLSYGIDPVLWVRE